MSSLPWAVMRMTGTRGKRARAAWTSSRPSISGMIMSVTTTSMPPPSRAARASTPLPANTAFQPGILPTMPPARVRSMAESSTMRTVCGVSAGDSVGEAGVMAKPPEQRVG